MSDCDDSARNTATMRCAYCASYGKTRRHKTGTACPVKTREERATLLLKLKEYLFRRLASEIEHHKGNGSEWLFPDELTEAQQKELLALLDQVVADFDVKAARLATRIDLIGEERIP